MFLKMVIIFNIEILYFDTTAVLYLKLFMDTLFCQLHEGGREGGCLQCACQHVQSFISNVSHVSMCNVSMCKGERQNSF